MHLKLNSRGPQVVRLQNFLNGWRKRSERIRVDGLFGPKTKEAVIKFQTKEKLTAKGEVDLKTWVALGVPFAEKVGTVFSSAQASKIHFQLGTVNVTPQRTRDVGKAIADGRISVRVAPAGKLLGAAYTPHTNKMTIGRRDFAASLVARSGILHEGVHALVDMFHLKTTVLNDEAVAYLAEVVFLKAAGGWVNGNAAAMKIYKAADALAQSKGLYNKRGARLTFQEAEPLRKAIHANPAYNTIDEHEHTGGHGVP